MWAWPSMKDAATCSPAPVAAMAVKMRMCPYSHGKDPLAVGLQNAGGGDEEVGPPHAEGQPCAREADQRRVQGPALVLDHRGQRRDGADDALTEGDDRQQPVALGDVVGMPGGPALADLGDPRAGQLKEDQRARQQEEPQDRRLHHD
jgi:hypothetical protein